MDLHRLDLNLLIVFDAMLSHRSVTLAGESIDLSQPAMSGALARLRKAFDDPMFVRHGAEMLPTPRALELSEAVRGVLERVRREILQRPHFEAQRTDRTFTLITPDIGEMLFVPPLLARFAVMAPQARLKIITRPRAAAAEALASGEAELAIGYFPDLQVAGFFQQKLFDNPHVCLVREAHPGIGTALSWKAYQAASHALVRPEGRQHVFEQFMQQRGVQLHVVVELAHFMSLTEVLGQTDLVATVPRDVAQLACRHAPLRIVPLPLEAPVIPVHQFWHSLHHRDPAHMWLRGLVHSTLGWAPEAGDGDGPDAPVGDRR